MRERVRERMRERERERERESKRATEIQRDTEQESEREKQSDRERKDKKKSKTNNTQAFLTDWLHLHREVLFPDNQSLSVPGLRHAHCALISVGLLCGVGVIAHLSRSLPLKFLSKTANVGHDVLVVLWGVCHPWDGGQTLKVRKGAPPGVLSRESGRGRGGEGGARLLWNGLLGNNSVARAPAKVAASWTGHS